MLNLVFGALPFRSVPVTNLRIELRASCQLIINIKEGDIMAEAAQTNSLFLPQATQMNLLFAAGHAG